MIHPCLFREASAQRKETVLRSEERDKSVHSYMQSTSYFDVSLHGGIPPGRPPDLEWGGGTLPLGSLLFDSREVNIMEDEFGIGDVKVVGNSVTRASHSISPALSLRRIDPYWRSQLLVEYSKDLGACLTIDDLDGYDRYMVVDVFIYSDGMIFSTRYYSLKEKLLHATHEDLFSMNFDAYISLIEKFTWEGIQHDLFQHMERCIAWMVMERRS